MGKSRRSDGEATRAKILEAAGQLIAVQGFAYTTNKAIAQKAGVDLATINYHFGGRDGLYQAVLIEGHRHYLALEELAALAESSMAPHSKLTRLIEQIILRLMEERSWHARVFVRELFSPSVQTAEFIQSEVMPKAQYLRSIMHQATGIPEHDPAILHCLMSVMAPCLSLILLLSGSEVTGLIQQVLGMSGTERLIENLNRFSLAGLDAVSTDYQAR
ncbi:MAG: CerR family C-terminal domain-containing protein [Desulfatitalea sp.]|nr:CerR family C-terminal domain-containing protein [Desulfatitalea sp.]NNK02480.1 CerR family C-terminal domain-containing protein [Desulfatitalea sp.]